MTTDNEHELKAGWGFPGRSRKAHYFEENGRSLCGRWGFYSGPTEQGNDASPENCAACKQRLLKRRGGHL